jgi:hypothetical protein
LRWTPDFVEPKIISMKMLALVLCLSWLGPGVVPNLAAETPRPDLAKYGPYPSNYKEIVTQWLDTLLLDPASAKIEWEGDPQPTDLGIKGRPLYGWLVKFKVNSRNRFGTYTGKQAHGALIRNGEVVKGTGFGY